MRNLPETVHEYNISKLNIIFIISSLLLIGCVVWMLADDFTREWKPIQRQSKLFEKQKLLQDRAAAEKKMEEAGYATTTNSLAEAEALLMTQASQTEAIQKRLTRVVEDLDVAKNRYAGAKAMLDQRKSEYDEAVEFHRSPAKIEEHLKKMRAQQELVADLDHKVQELDGQKTSISAELDEYTSKKTTLEKEARRLATEKGLIEKRLAQLQNKALPALLDQPLIEFAAPTISVKQVIAEDQTYSLNFVEVSRIDRCTTCHSFVDKKDPVTDSDEGFKFSNLPQPWRSHPRLDLFVSADSPHPIERFGCSTCHLGWDRGTKFINAAHTPPFFNTKIDYVKLPLVEGAPYWVASESVEKWKPGLLSKVQEHAKLMEEKRSLKKSRSQDPDKLKEVRDAIAAARTELKDKYGMDTKALSQFQFASLTQREAWELPPLKFDAHSNVLHHKEDPMRPREFVESSCLKCHQGVSQVPIQKDPTGNSETNPGEKLNAGLRLIEQAGCYACHKMQALETVVKHVVKPGETLEGLSHSMVAEPEAILAANNLASAADLKAGREVLVPVRVPYSKPGPSLLKVAAKTSKEWMVKWLEHPKGFRPNTFMPQFWNLDNNRDGMRFNGVVTENDKPVEIDWADRSAVERQAITEYLFKLSDPIRYPAPPSGDSARGEALVNSVGCMGCHVLDQKLSDVAPKDRRFRSQGPMLFGAGSKYDAGWLYAWLKDPKQYRANTRMPNLRLSDQEAADITAFLMKNHNQEFEQKSPPEIKSLVLKDTTIDYLKGSMPVKQAFEQAEKMSDDEKLQYLGDKLVQRYGCMDCHNIKGMENAKPISIELSDWASKNPTKLDFGYIDIPHNNYAYLHQKLEAPRSFDRVETKHPQELMRMPQYNFSDEQIELIMTAVMGMTNEKPNAKARRNLNETEWYIENGRHLIQELNCLGCHINEGDGGAIRRTMDEDKTFLFPPSLQGVGLKVRPTWLQAFLREPGKHPYRYWMEARMPTYGFTDDEINTLTQYFALRDKQPYPFELDTMETVSPSPQMAEIGGKIVEKAGCMSCHAVRELEKAREAGNPAINLGQVKDRMRPKGIVPWLTDPNAVTPGVNMPAFWPHDGASPLPDFLEGNSEKQIEAVAAFLKSHSASAPPSAPAK